MDNATATATARSITPDAPDTATPDASTALDVNTGTAETPQQRHAATVVASTAPSARKAVACNLRRAASLAMGHPTDAAYPWHRASPATLAKVRADLRDSFATATANASIASVRAVLRCAWLDGDLTRDALERDARGAETGSPVLARRGGCSCLASLPDFSRACADRTPSGARDAALFAMMYGCGLRVAEATAATMGDLDAANGTLTVRGKGRRQRLAYPFANGAGAALRAWLAVRGDAPGPVFNPVHRSGVVRVGESMSARACAKRLTVRAAAAGIGGKVSPHVLRRSFATGLLTAGNDLATVGGVMGHASLNTTRIYDRRPEDARRAACATLAVPYLPAG